MAQQGELNEAINTTGATTGQVVSIAQGTVANLSPAQRTAFRAFITSLGAAWPGQPSHVTNVVLNRYPGGQLATSVTGYVVHADASTAVGQATAGSVNQILGQAP